MKIKFQNYNLICLFLLQEAYNLLCKGTSSGEKGTLFQLRNLFDRRGVKSEVNIMKNVRLLYIYVYHVKREMDANGHEQSSMYRAK